METILQRYQRLRETLNKRPRPLTAREQFELLDTIVSEATQGNTFGAIKTTENTVGFYGKTPTAQPAALTASIVASGATFTTVAPAGTDYLIQALVQNTGFGFVTANEGQSFLAIVKNNHLRLEELETKLTALGILASA